MLDCWFCGKGNNDDCWLFCCEFDCYMHEQCLREAVADASPDDRELAIIAAEFTDLLAQPQQ